MTNSIEAGRELYRARHASRATRRDDAFTFDDIAGSKVAEGRALYRALHGDEDARQTLHDVHAAYREAGAQTESDQSTDTRLGRALRDFMDGR